MSGTDPQGDRPAEPEQPDVPEGARDGVVLDPAEQRREHERLVARLAHQWAELREERAQRLMPQVPEAVPTAPAAAGSRTVPWGVDVAAAWSWRLIVIGFAGLMLLRLVGFFSVLVLPLVVALLFAALVVPVVDLLCRLGLPRPLAAIGVVVGVLAGVAALLTLAGQQVAAGANDLAAQTVQGLGEIRTWLQDGPLHASDSQINDYIAQAQQAIANAFPENGDILRRVTEVGTAVGHVFAGLFIVLFGSYFFLADGERIWAWTVRLSPRAARWHVDSSGRVAWISLTQFVRATVVVAATDALFIMIGAAALRVPFVLAIGVLVFLGAFIPLVGASVAGAVAVLVALVDQGPFTALLMLAVIVAVQQLEGHVLQPFLMGRWVAVHPLAVIIAIAAGVLVAGIAGALVAVPIAAVVNAVVQHLASYTAPGDDPVDDLARDYAAPGPPPDRSLPEIP